MAETGNGTKASNNRRRQDKKNEQQKNESIAVAEKTNSIKTDEKAIERNKYVLELVNMWIASADNKINIAFAMLSALVAITVFIADSLLSGLTVSQNAKPCILNSFYIVAVIAAVCFFLSVFFYVFSVIPRLTSDKTTKYKKKCKEKKSSRYSIFYDEIKDFEKAIDYVKEAQESNDDIFSEEILKEIYYNSGICSKKMYWFRRGALASLASIFFSLVAALLYFLYAMGI